MTGNNKASLILALGFVGVFFFLFMKKNNPSSSSTKGNTIGDLVNKVIDVFTGDSGNTNTGVTTGNKTPVIVTPNPTPSIAAGEPIPVRAIDTVLAGDPQNNLQWPLRRLLDDEMGTGRIRASRLMQ